MDNLKVFISSPGDVEVERTLVSKVINLLQIEFDEQVVLEAVLWEREVLLATANFQDQLDLPSVCDIAVFILGDRIGTPLPPNYHREDGSRYLSGTEFEFEDAIAGFRKNGYPHILVYKKYRDKYIKLDDRVDEILNQKRELEKFVNKWFLDDENKAFSGAFYSFNSSDEFEHLVETHLYKLISQLVVGHSENRSGAEKQWLRGNPYLGLNSFRYEDAPIYFGRTRAISECIDLLDDADDFECPFLLILGMSGGGKSSLVHAGILPMLTGRGIDRGIRISRWASIRPTELQGSLVQHLISTVVNQFTALDEKKEVWGRERLLQLEQLSDDEELTATLLTLLNKEKEYEDERFVLVVDQFEELFTSSAISESERNRFVVLLDALVRGASVWCICTLRSDFYPELTSLPMLVTLKTDGAQFDLPAPTPSEISLMIRGPAIAAGLHFEKDSTTGISLDERIRNIAEDNPEILPLLEYTLSELYEQCDADGWLTNKAYMDLGGVEGALAKSAERCFESLSREEQESLPIVFNTLFDFSPDGSSGRRWASVEDLQSREALGFLSAFVDARLFVMELDSNEQQIVTVTHESLFRYWPRLSEWVENNRDQLRVRSRVSAASELWAQQGQSADLLLGRGIPAEEAGLLVDSGLSLSETTRQFIQTSLARVQLNRRFRYGGFFLVFVFAIVAGVSGYLANLSNNDALRRLAQNDDLITFMLDDLIEQLRPIGRLEPIRIVGEKAINYFETIDDKDRTDTARLKHAQALRQVGQIYFEAGEFNVATQAFSESLRQARILHELDRLNTDREFELGQAYYWVALSKFDSGKLNEAEEFLLRYFEISESLAKKRPDNVDWQMELGYAYQNLGALEERRNQNSEALVYFDSATRIFSTLVETYPDRGYIARELAENYSWLGSNYRDMGDLDRSLTYFLREEEITRRLVEENDDANWRYSLMHAYRHLGELYIDLGNLGEARDQFNLGLNIADKLVASDDQNIDWIYGKALCRFYLAQISVYMDDNTTVKQSLDRALAAIDRLRDSDNLNWRILEIRAQLLQAVHNFRVNEINMASEMIVTTDDDIKALLLEYPDNLELRRLALKSNLVLLMRNEDLAERAQILADASELVTQQLLSSDRPEDLIAMLMFYANRGDENDQLTNYRDKLEGIGVKHPEIEQIMTAEYY